MPGTHIIMATARASPTITSPPTSRASTPHTQPRASAKLPPLEPEPLAPLEDGQRVRARAPAASMPLELRLRALEARVLGVPASQLRPAPRGDGDTLARRVGAAARAVEDAVGQAPQLKVLYERCTSSLWIR
jgi:hypothetical protein